MSIYAAMTFENKDVFVELTWMYLQRVIEVSAHRTPQVISSNEGTITFNPPNKSKAQ
ncbi:protein of unknown function [Shewanella benthica]|uniref:Uncharacterized protein n=1 Tax=Shewanella benthica TaxID=43661 RepID=A0A330M964_9GAMM|nr:protein of unknown function [Shewanella benthica]